MFLIGPYRIETPYLLAPMAGVSEMPFRVLAFRFGAGLATTELISAKGLLFQSLRTKQYLSHDPKVETPFSVQLFGGEEEPMAYAAKTAFEAGAHIIDINMGCPVKKVTKTGAGSALLCNPSSAARLIEAMRKATNNQVPITAKIRSGWDMDTLNFISFGQALEAAGCAAIAIHARTRAQGYSGKANWEHIRLLKQALRIPVIGNGDVATVEDACRMQKETDCDGVMVGRGALGNPWVFQSLLQNRTYIPSVMEKQDVLFAHLDAHLAFRSQLSKESGFSQDKAQLQAIRSFRPHLVWYSKGLCGASFFRQQIMQVECLDTLKQYIRSFFSNTEIEASEQVDDFAVDYRQAFG